MEHREAILVRMDWVVPPDRSPGAGHESVLRTLAGICPEPDFLAQASRLRPEDLDDKANRLAQEFIARVKDAYYSTPDSGAWEDMTR